MAPGGRDRAPGPPRRHARALAAGVDRRPESYHEGVPRFLLEAAASGLPLVGTDIDGCRTVIRDGVNGLLVPPRDVESLTRAISRLVGDPDLRARMGAASRDVAVAEFEEEAILDGYEAVYRRLGVVA